MATFAIHEDELLKENACVPRLLEHKQHPQQQQPQIQRKTFGVLNNAQLGARAHAQKTTELPNKQITVQRQPLQLKQKTTNDENDMQSKQLLAAAAAAAKKAIQQQLAAQQVPNNKKVSVVPVDAFKAFCVYEDENKMPAEMMRGAPDGSCDISLDSALNISAVRNPLQEIRDVHLETPMSVGEFLASPMSVDKSMLDATPTNASSSTEASSSIEKQISQMRERFFDVAEYQTDILEYLKEAENKHLPKFGYMRKQPDINHSMRTILVDWLVEVCEEYRLQSETLCLAVSYIDRFLSTMSVVRAKLQLVGTAAMFIASKYEEIYPPDVGEFVYITDHTYSKKQVLRMEQLILKVLTFDLFVPTTATFVSLYVTMNQMEERIKYLATYLCELSLIEADPYLQYVPSRTAAAALALARYTIDKPMWTRKLERQTGYSLDHLKEVLFHLTQTQAAAGSSPQQAIQDKYKSNKYLEVATLSAAAPFDEFAYKQAVLALSHEADNEDDDDVESALFNNAANDSVNQMISSLAFA